MCKAVRERQETMTTGKEFDGIGKRYATLLCVAAAVIGVNASADPQPAGIAWLITSSSGNPTYFPGAGKWQVDGAAEPSADAPNDSLDYGVKDGKQLRPPVGTSTFAGRSLSIGSPDSASTGSILFRTPNYDSDTTFDNNGLYLYGGQIGSWNGNRSTVRGKVHVMGNSDNVPFCVYVSGAGGSMDFHGPVSGNSDGWLWLHSRLDSGSQSQTNFVCRFFDDALSGFAGTVTCAQFAYSTTRTKWDGGYRMTFAPDAGTFPGTLDLYTGADIAPVACTSDFAVANLVVRDGPHALTVRLSEDRTTCSCVRVTGALTWPASLSSPVVVRLDEPYPATLDITNCAARLAVFKAPAGVTLNPADFALIRNDALPHLPTYALGVADDESGLSTLWLVRQSGPIVVQTVSAGSNDNTYQGKAAYWSNSAAPGQGNDYLLCAKSMRTGKVTTVAEFPGDSLSLSGGAVLNIRCGGISVGDLRAFGYCEINNLGGAAGAGEVFATEISSTYVVTGKVKTVNVGTDSNDSLVFRAYNKKALDIQADISGSGCVYFFASPQNSDTPAGYFQVSGDNTGFAGRMAVFCDSALLNGNLSRRSHLYFDNAGNLGGPCGAWTYNALVLGNYSELHPSASLTLDEPTRGIAMANAHAAFDVPDGVTFTCKERITYNGVMTKKGTGELALGGPQPYFTSDGTTAPASAKNVLDVWEGTLRPVSAAAFQGLEVVITNGATLAVDVPVSNTDGDIGQYGMLNTAWDRPLVVPEEGIVVQLRDPEGVLLRKGRCVVPVCTVNATARHALEGKLSFGCAPALNYNVSQFGWTENQDGSFTFAATIKRAGLVFVVQ